MKLLETITLKGEIHILTGLHIGAGKETTEIGGMDNPVIKHPHTGEPYIPGSSLKGKIRSLLEWCLGKVDSNGEVWKGRGDSEELSKDPILRIFGATEKNWKGGPTRLIARDAFLNEDWKNDILDRNLPYTEEKLEVVIDRIQGKAAGTGPRRMERVPAGAIFDFSFNYRIFDMGDNGKTDLDYFNFLLLGMHLLENDALGGSGSRGYGKIKFKKLYKNNEPWDEKYNSLNIEELVKKGRSL